MNTDTVTPRTDEEQMYDQHGITVVTSKFARTLECELTQANQKIQDLEKDKQRLDWLGSAEWHCEQNPNLIGADIRTAIDSAIEQSK